MPISKPGFFDPTIIKTVASDNDYVVMIDASGVPYKITKANLLSGSTSGGSGNQDAYDPQFSSVILLLKCLGANGSTTIIDSSTTGKTISNSGVTINTAIKKYEQASFFFNGYALFDVPMPDFNWTGNFAIDFWYQTPDIQDLGTILDMRPDATNGQYLTLSQDQGRLSYYQNAVELMLTNQLFSNNQWYYIGLKRINGTISLWVDGQLVGSASSANFTPSNRLLVGSNAFRQFAPQTFSYCYISGLRVTNSDRDLGTVTPRAFSTQ